MKMSSYYTLHAFLQENEWVSLTRSWKTLSQKICQNMNLEYGLVTFVVFNQWNEMMLQDTLRPDMLKCLLSLVNFAPNHPKQEMLWDNTSRFIISSNTHFFRQKLTISWTVPDTLKPNTQFCLNFICGICHKPSKIPWEDTHSNTINNSNSNTSLSLGATAITYEELDSFISINTTKLQNSFLCNFCSETKNDSGNMKRHIEAKHCILPPLYCSICNQPAKNRNALQKHMGTYHKSS